MKLGPSINTVNVGVLGTLVLLAQFKKAVVEDVHSISRYPVIFVFLLKQAIEQGDIIEEQ